jgi:HSP20 family protein
MTAQRSTQLATSQGEQRGEQRGKSELARRTGVPSLPSLLLDPLGFFDDDPFSVFRRMQRDMNRVFGQAGLDVSRRGDDFLASAWAPATEISFRDGKLIVSAELPGLTEKDVKVEINNDFLVIQGERKFEQEQGDGGVRRTERRYGEFYRAIALPEGADVEHASAEFRNGVLQVSIPVPEAPNNVRQIPVQTASGDSQRQGGSQKQSASDSTQGQKAA